MNEFHPDLIIYNAGTDILDGDPLGKLHISADGIKLRDETVFKIAKDNQIPILMLTRFGILKQFSFLNSNSNFLFSAVDINALTL